MEMYLEQEEMVVELVVMEEYKVKNYNVMQKVMKRQLQLKFEMHDVEYHYQNLQMEMLIMMVLLLLL
jgi:hypothetical protein